LGFLERHLIRLVTYASITRPLTEQAAEPSWATTRNWGVTCTIRMGSDGAAHGPTTAL